MQLWYQHWKRLKRDIQNDILKHESTWVMRPQEVCAFPLKYSSTVWLMTRRLEESIKATHAQIKFARLDAKKQLAISFALWSFLFFFLLVDDMFLDTNIARKYKAVRSSGKMEEYTQRKKHNTVYSYILVPFPFRLSHHVLTIKFTLFWMESTSWLSYPMVQSLYFQMGILHACEITLRGSSSASC